jgi:head-tail adaptor
MNSGVLTEKIIFQKKGTIKNIYGEIQETSWVDEFSTKAYLKDQDSQYVLANMEHQFVESITFCIWLYNVKKLKGKEDQYRISYGGRVYRILSMRESRKRQVLEIKCELINE